MICQEKCVDTELFRYALPLVDGRMRQGLLVRLSDKGGIEGWGEVAPWPGFSAETLEQAETQLAHWQDEKPLFPSVQCGIEMALLDLTARRTGCSVSRLLSKQPLTHVRLNGLLTRLDDETCAEHLWAQGYRCLKVKVGERPIEEEIELLHRLVARFGPALTLRIDANRRWHLSEVFYFAQMCRDLPIEYIEEPLKNPSEKTLIPLPLALDETLYLGEPIRCRPAAYILKPTLLGGIRRTLALAIEAHQIGAQCVISSTFETGIGLRILAHLAAVCQPANASSGLSTFRFYEKDLLDIGSTFADGALSLDALDALPIARQCLTS